MKLSVIIVNYNVKYFLEQCLCSVQKACARIDAEIYVVDNSSTDGSRQYLSARFPDISFRWNNSNDGFAKANNLALQEATGDYVLFLNPDTIVPEDCLEKCIHFFETRKQCGALGVRMIDGSGHFLKESKRSFPSAATSFYKMIGLTALLPLSPVFARYYATHIKENESGKVDVLPGAFMMLSKEAVKATGGFDERFFMYAEDIDLSYRVQQAGFKNYYFPETTIIHFKGESTSKMNPMYYRHFYGAMKLFVEKHYQDKKFKLMLMKTGIWLGEKMAMMKQLLTAKAGKSEMKPAASTMVIATQAYFNTVLRILKYAQPPLMISGRIAVTAGDRDAAAGKIENVEHIITKNQVKQLLFCEGELSFKKIIELIQELKGKVSFLIHSKNAHSVVGSNEKDRNGIFIALPDEQ